MPKREGPTIEIKKSCHGCAHLSAEHYTCQSDSGCDLYCLHPSITKRVVGDTRWDTPEWCPAMPPSDAATIATLRADLATCREGLRVAVEMGDTMRADLARVEAERDANAEAVWLVATTRTRVLRDVAIGIEWARVTSECEDDSIADAWYRWFSDTAIKAIDAHAKGGSDE